MDKRKLGKLEKQLRQLRGRVGNIKPRELEKFARALGREADNTKGKEPTYKSTAFNDVRPVSIPHHGSKNLKPGTANNILDFLEGDIAKFREQLDDDERDE